MELESSRVLPVDRPTAWAALNDPAALKAAIPGCESMERSGENEYAVVVAAAVGPVKAKFHGKLSVSDIVAPERYVVHFDGQGGVAGFAKGSAHVQLADEGAQTRLTYKARAQVGGRIAQVGQRLVDAAAAKIADRFFEEFAAGLAARAGAPAPAAPARAPAARIALWAAIVAALVAIVVLVLLLR